MPSLGSQPSCGVQVTVLGGQWEPESPCWWGGELGVVMGQDPGSHLDAGWKRGYGGLENSLCCPQSKHQPLLFFFFHLATPTAYRCSQARDQTRATEQ